MATRNIYNKLREAFGDPIGSYAGDAPVGVRSIIQDGNVCPSCNMMPVGGQCGCDEVTSGEELCDCGMPVNRCECEGHMHEAVEPCVECGMYEVEGSCGCTHNESELEEVTPPGKEKMVKALKKDPDIDNPWAVAWAAHEKEKKKK